MAKEIDQDVLRRRVVDATIPLHAGIQAMPGTRTRQLIRLRQVLGDMCLASEAWTAPMESADQADIAALRKLGEHDSVRPL
jgi:hypothetical protein